ncbi:MAG TPA: S8 family serine peptidase [Conexibacter sp.]|nr:S8 family serine peptidase [Conexibacter sp.]
MSQRAFTHPVRAAARALAVGAVLLALPSAVLAAPEQSNRGTPQVGASAPISSRIIVEWEPGATSAERASGRDDADTNLVYTLGKPQFQLVAPQAGQTVVDALEALRDDPSVRAATRDGSSTLNATTNDPLFGQLWGLQNLGLGIDGFAGALPDADVDVERAWDRTRGSSSVVIADIDTGYRYDAPDLAPVAWTNPGEIAGNNVDDDGNGFRDDVHGYDFVGPSADSPTSDADPTDDNIISGGHGVHTAGTMGAAGNNGLGISGVAQDVRIMALRVCADSAANSHDGRCPTSSQISAINYAGAMGARAANMSLGGTTFSTLTRDAIASNPRTLFVISAGNDAQNNDPGGTPHYPCAYDPTTSGIGGAIDNIVCVAATDQADGLASFSDWGATSVDLGAPGTEVYSAYPVLRTHISDGFETNNFGSVWSNGGAGFGRASAGDGPLTSFGMNDSPGVTPTASTAREVTMTTGAALPAGTGSCILSGRRRIARGSGGSFFYEVLSNGGSAFFNSTATNTAGSGMTGFSTIPITGLGGTTVRLHFGFTAGSSPTSADGLWLDDLKLTCYAPLATAPTYGFLDGTSMAAPHVTGAAGLLFSLKPSATVTEVKSALLASANPVASLTGRTTTGGRLNVADALDTLVPPPPSPPAPPVVNPPSGGGGGRATTATVVCVVPRLAGLSLAKAKAALTAAHCALGRVTKPRARRGRRLPALVVKSSSPAIGSRGAAGTKVALTMKAKPAARRRARRRR